ncbi:MAG: hypothetical protein HY513_05070 [Candidatus Aenigmarchaeota archaeon]|nr:hypothetical protein [Candidatus Aenigmarchaeota archaeon]
MFAALRRLAGGYDLSPISVVNLLNHRGFDVKVRHFAYQTDRFPEYMSGYLWDEEWPGLIEELRRRRTPETSYNISRLYFEQRAEEAEFARGRINYGIQVASRLGKKVNRVAGIRVIGAESRLEARSKERGIRDLDLNITVYEPVDTNDVQKINSIKQQAEEKTGIEVDVLCPGLPLTDANMEHTMAADYPLYCRGFPIFWREERYLDHVLEGQNEFFEIRIPQLRTFMKSFELQ